MVGARGAATEGVVGASTCLNLTVGVASIVRHRSARRSVGHVVHQLFLVRESVNAVLVFHGAGQARHFHAVDAVSVFVGQHVVTICSAPAAPWSGHEHLREGCRAIHGGSHCIHAAHVHVERGGASTRSVACTARVVHVRGVVSTDFPEAVGVVCVIRDGRASTTIDHGLDEVFLDAVDNPEVLHVVGRCWIKRHRPSTVAIVGCNGASNGVPAPEWTCQAHSVGGRTTKVHGRNQHSWSSHASFAAVEADHVEGFGQARTLVQAV